MTKHRLNAFRFRLPITHMHQSLGDVFPFLTTSLSVSLPGRVDDPDNIPEKRSHQGVLHLDLISTLRDWKKETRAKERIRKNTQGSDILLKPQDLNSADLQKSKSGWIYTTE